MLINEKLYADTISGMEYNIAEIYNEDFTYDPSDLCFFVIDDYGVIGIEAGEDWNLVFPELTIKQLTQLENGQSVGPIHPIEL
ncbi:hypothetical protein QUW35_00625 [Ligilactobacillus agilis]|uniref:hypothetical protein n=1 Tax=Ligilactobacillus agilis TaxID=1601 RepID=UPI0025A4231A|nr:hypothetical protein [Ligilactobacillus agilis]MDM8279201.1 hypothetical protein [Ligilactobacillus agilis]